MLKKTNLVIMIILCVSIFSAALVVNASSVYDRHEKNIYFVMDDSGSMMGKREWDANYSLQTLIAMCDKEDTINLYSLNTYSSIDKKIHLSLSDKDNSMIQSVNQKYPWTANNWGTLYGAVENAKKDLKSSVNVNDVTEYWLVVFTDGGFNDGSDAKSDLLSFSQEKLANGEHPNVLYVYIGGDGERESNGSMHYLPGANVVDAMNEAAKIISGRIEVTDLKLEKENTKLTFNIPYPAKNIIVFSQNSEVEIVDYTCGSKLDISENYTVEYPKERQPIGKSTVCFVKEENNSSIASGDVTFVFNKQIVKKNTVVLFEPALGIVAHFYNQEGAEIDPGSICADETVRLEFSICDSEKNQPIDETALGKVKYYAKINDEYHSSNDFEFKVDSGELKVEMFAELPDGYVIFTNDQYDVEQPKRYVVFTLSNGGKYKADIEELDETEGIYANLILNNGDPVTDDQFEQCELEIKGENVIASNFSIERDKDNLRFVIKPKKGFISPLTPRHKTYDVVLKYNGEEIHTQTLDVEITGARKWWLILVMLAVAYLVICFLFKKRFPFGTVFEIYGNDRPSYFNVGDPAIVSLWRLRFRELKYRDGWIHLLLYIFTPCAVRVTLYELTDTDDFAHIELRANSKAYVLGRVKGVNKHTAETYEPDFEILDANFNTPGNVKEFKFDRIVVRLNYVLSKVSDGYYVYDVRYTTKKERKRRV